MGETADGELVDVAGISPIVLPSLNFVDDELVKNQSLLTVVGYGTGEVMGIPGEEPIPGGPSGFNPDTFGVRYFADMSLFVSTHGKSKNLLLDSQNTAGDSMDRVAGTLVGRSSSAMAKTKLPSRS